MLWPKAVNDSHNITDQLAATSLC